MTLSPETIAIIQAVQDSEARTQARIAEMEAKTEKFMCGFPDGDPDGHRAYHEVVIERQKLRNEIMRGAVVMMGKGGVVAITLAFFWLAWELIKIEVRK